MPSPPLRQIGIAQLVCYYRNGNLNAEPTVAVVTAVSDSGALTLALIPKYGGALHHQHAYRENIYHVDSAYFRRNPGRIDEDGCWDWPEAADERRMEAARQKRRAAAASHALQMRPEPNLPGPSQALSDTERRVLELHRDGKDSTAIAQSVKVKREEVERIIEENALLV